MTLNLYNSMSERVEEIIPITPGRIGMYTCGPTVHDFAHIGNLRTYVAEDLLRRELEAEGLAVTQVMNITDVDDKIIRKAEAAEQSLDEYTAPFIEAFSKDLELLAIQPAHRYPRATRYVPQMLDLVAKLVAGGHAYERDGSVYFRISSFPAYGRLTHLDTSGLKLGGSGRIDADEYEVKEEVRDFVLWKGGRPGDIAGWSSPYGWGRPGWHLECSAMAMEELGPELDLHCGGVDNKFPHHENEIAQSEAATGETFVRHWFHTEHLQIQGGKMAKSLGNFVTLADLVERGHDPLAVRYLLLTGAHYRHKLQFHESLLVAAESDLNRLAEFWRRCREGVEALPTVARDPLIQVAERARARFDSALEDDLNLPEGVGALFELVRDGNRLLDRAEAGREGAAAALGGLERADTRLAVIRARAEQVETLPPAAQTLLDQRDQARQERDFGRSDQLRDQLLELGIQVEDTKSGTRWHRV